MLGGIYTSDKCAICGRGMVDNGRNAVACTDHPKQRAAVFIVRFGRRVWKKFSNYDEAGRFLTGVRFKVDENTFDLRDYQTGNPLGFANLADKWLDLKKSQIKRHSWDTLNNTIRKASNEWENRNIKEIGYAEIEDFLFITLAGLSTKTVNNAASVLRSFFMWLGKRKIIHFANLPEIPEVPFELESRQTISKQNQEVILGELRRISWAANPRIWIAVKWLATYISIRPGELIRIREQDVNRETGFVIIPHPKEKRPKIIPLTDEDLELIRTLPRGFPDMPFFRHAPGRSGIQAGKPFGQRYLYKWWKRACANLGIEGVDLYGGTRHSTVIALGEFFTPEQLKKASFHSTNKAFERYYRMKPEEVKSIYSAATPRQHGKEHDNVINPWKTGGGGGS